MVGALLTPRLRLRPLTSPDAPALAGYRNDPAVARYQSWIIPYTVADATMLIEELAQSDPTVPGWFQYGIERRSDGELIGDLGVRLFENTRQAEIGFTIAASAQGTGFGQEAVRRILDHLFVVVGLHKVSAECDARNTASAHLLTRVGFRQEGHLRAHTWAKGEWTDDLLFGMLADDYLPDPTPPGESAGRGADGSGQ